MKTFSILLSLFTIGVLIISLFASPIPKPQASVSGPCQNGGSCAAGTILQWVAANGDAGTSCDCICVGGYSGDSCEYAPASDPAACSGNGYFFELPAYSPTGTSGRCICNNGYTGYSCEIPPKKQVGERCSAWGEFCDEGLRCDTPQYLPDANGICVQEFQAIY